MIRKEQQRFSLRKYKVGVASVFLGTTLSFMMANGGTALASEFPAQLVTEAKTELVNTRDSSGESSNKDVETTDIYHVEEVQGTEAGVEYDKMVVTVGVTVTKEGKVLTLTSQMPEDTEFNNKVTPPTPPTQPVTPPTPEKPKGRELPNTGEQTTAGVVALGVALGPVGLGLVTKQKRRED